MKVALGVLECEVLQTQEGLNSVKPGLLSYSVFRIHSRLFQGYGGYLKRKGSVVKLLLPVFKTEAEARRKLLSDFESVAEAEPADGSVLNYLKQYLSRSARAPSFSYSFDELPLSFQEIYRLCQEIPFGATISYGQLAERWRKRSSARVVALAMARNPLPLVVPCHRVVSANGPGGYSYGMVLKQKLLAFEKYEKAL